MAHSGRIEQTSARSQASAVSVIETSYSPGYLPGGDCVGASAACIRSLIPKGQTDRHIGRMVGARLEGGVAPGPAASAQNMPAPLGRAAVATSEAPAGRGCRP